MGRTLRLWLGFATAAIALVAGLFALAVDPGLGDTAGGVALLTAAFFALAALPAAAVVVTLVYLFDCWPAVLRGRHLGERLGASADDLSNSAQRKVVGERAYWAAVARGAAVGWGFASAGLIAAHLASGKWMFVGLSPALVLAGGQLAGRAWVVRRVVAMRASPSPTPG